MSLVIRLTKRGKKGEAKYRLVVCEKRQRRDGKFIEEVGFYRKYVGGVDKKINIDRVNYWIAKGAKPSTTVKKLIKT